MNNRTKKVVFNSAMKEAEKELKEFGEKPSSIFHVIKFINKK